MSVKLSVFLRALGLMGYTLEIKKEGKRWFPSGRRTTHRRRGKTIINKKAPRKVLFLVLSALYSCLR